jgi:putative spermidine/putrescine transport system substrate-binding protein
MNRRTLIWLVPTAILAFIVAALWWLTRPLPELVVTTWPGAYARAQAIAMLRPYGEAKHIDVRIAEYDGGLDHLRREVTTRAYDWDVVDLELADAVEACRLGLLETIDLASLPPAAEGTEAHNDFVQGALGRCWVGSVVFSLVIAYSPARFANKPRTLADFFDTKHFPGGRALRRSSPKLNLELALLADGVKPPNVYPLLSTPAGIARAFAKLSTLRGSIVWWTRSSEPVEMLADGRAAIATSLNGRTFDAATHGQKIGVIWDRQLYELDAFGVPRGNPRRARAMDFIRYATGTTPLAQVAQWVPYGPARHSSIAFVGKNPELGVAMRPHLPTAPENFATAFAVDDEWWLAHKSEVDRRWRQWLLSGQ